MARTLTFSLNGKEFSTGPERVDRKKLYGWTEVLALDDNGNECKLVSMDESGTVIIPSKGRAAANLSLDKHWLEKSSFKAVLPDGTPAEKHPSSYSAPIELKEIASAEEYLGHTITAFYQLYGVEGALLDALRKDIYAFDYSYSESYDSQRGFLIENEGNVFMLIGVPTAFEMLGLAEASVIEESAEEEEEEEEESDAFDFGSMF